MKEPWLLTAGHTANLWLPIYRIGNPSLIRVNELRSTGVKIGRVERDAYHGGNERIDASAIRLNAGGIVPTRILGRDGERPRVGPAGIAHAGMVVCISGSVSSRMHCGAVAGFRYVNQREPTTSGKTKTVGLISIRGLFTKDGDSGGPVWHPQSMRSIGLHHGVAANGIRYAQPLVTTVAPDGRKYFGALNAPVMGELFIRTEG